MIDLQRAYEHRKNFLKDRDQQIEIKFEESIKLLKKFLKKFPKLNI